MRIVVVVVSDVGIQIELHTRDSLHKVNSDIDFGHSIGSVWAMTKTYRKKTTKNYYTLFRINLLHTHHK